MRNRSVRQIRLQGRFNAPSRHQYSKSTNINLNKLPYKSRRKPVFLCFKDFILTQKGKQLWY